MSLIDPTDYVEAETTLRFGDERQQAKFELGVCMAIYKWDELATAVDNSWGGPNSAEKRDWLSGIVIELFNEKVVDIAAIEETLLYAMVDEFDTEVDNDLALEIGALVFQIYKDCADKNYTRVDALYQAYQSKQPTPKRVEVAEDPNNPDSGDDEDEDVDEAGDLQMDVDHVHHEHNEPVVDDDGFELVQRRRR